MHAKFGLNKPDFEQMVADEQFTELAKKLQESLEKGKIRDGEYEVALDWLRKTAQLQGKTI
ncbi:MAG: hypothetical protein MJ188_00930 [Treponema sp.]|nr:hypothetical protein [Treponema sp.]